MSHPYPPFGYFCDDCGMELEEGKHTCHYIE